MLSFNAMYGQPAAMHRRRIWSGAERSVPGVSVHLVNALRQLGATSPAGVVADQGIHNGRLHFLAVGPQVYTSTDLKTLVLRYTFPGVGGSSSNAVVESFAERDGNVVIACSNSNMGTSAKSYASYVSTNDGVAFAASPLGAVKRVARAGALFYGFPDGNGLVCSETGASAATAVTLPGATTWQAVLHNGETYLALNTAGTVLATSADGKVFAQSAAFTTFKAGAGADVQVQHALVAGSKFVLLELRGSAVLMITTEDGVNFETSSFQLFGGDEQERVHLLGGTYAAMADGCAYVRCLTQDRAGVSRVRVIRTADGASWLTLPTLASTNSLSSTSGVAISKAIFGLGAGKGIYVAQGMDTVVHISETINDREFYYELG